MGKRKITNYAEEFKRSSAKLAVTSDQSINKTADELGVHVSTLHGWVNRYYPKSVGSDRQAMAMNPQEELKQLRKENVRLRQERDILKKAAAYCANDTR